MTSQRADFQATACFTAHSTKRGAQVVTATEWIRIDEVERSEFCSLRLLQSVKEGQDNEEAISRLPAEAQPFLRRPPPPPPHAALRLIILNADALALPKKAITWCHNICQRDVKMLRSRLCALNSQLDSRIGNVN